MKWTVDPAVLGGMSVRIGSDLYDGTVLRRLTDTRKALRALISAARPSIRRRMRRPRTGPE